MGQATRIGRVDERGSLVKVSGSCSSRNVSEPKRSTNKRIHTQTRIDRIPRRDVSFDNGFHAVHLYLITYLLQRGHPGVTDDCTADIGTFSKTYFKHWLAHPQRKFYIRQQSTGAKFELNKSGFEELLRIANVKVEDKIVRLGKIRGV
jgi:hypothetical protein